MSPAVLTGGMAPFTDRQVALIISAIAGTLVATGTPAETVKRALTFQLENFESMTKAVDMMRRGGTLQDVAKDMAPEHPAS